MLDDETLALTILQGATHLTGLQEIKVAFYENRHKLQLPRLVGIIPPNSFFTVHMDDTFQTTAYLNARFKNNVTVVKVTWEGGTGYVLEEILDQTQCLLEI